MKKILPGFALLLSFIAPIFAAEVTGVGNFSHIVADMERSVYFYKEVLQLEPVTVPTTFSDNPVIMQLGNTLGAQSLMASFRVPGSDMGVELIEYKDIARHPIQTRFQDPGAALLQIRVRDMDGILARLENSKGYIWTPDGKPVSVGEQSRIIFLKDPDGFFVEVIEMEPAADAVAGNVFAGSFELMINDSAETAAFYREGLGFDPQVGANFDDTPQLSITVNAPGAGFKRTTLTVTNTNLNISFLEFHNITRKPLNSKIQDPGTAILQLFSDDVAGLTKQLIAAGGTMITEGGEPVDLGGGRLLAIVRDPNNLFIEILPKF